MRFDRLSRVVVFDRRELRMQGSGVSITDDLRTEIPATRKHLEQADTCIVYGGPALNFVKSKYEGRGIDMELVFKLIRANERVPLDAFNYPNGFMFD